MNKSISYLSGLIVLVFACNQQEGVEVSGKIKSPVSGELVVLSKLEDEGYKPVDTVKINDNGTFEVYVQPMEPTFYRVNFYNRQMVNLILDGKEEEVKLTVDGRNPKGEFQVEGSRHTKYLKDIEGLIQDHQQDVEELNQQAIQARSDEDQERLADLTDSYFGLVRESQRNIKKYLWNITPSPAVFFGLQALKPEEHFTFYDSIASRFQQELPDHMLTKELVSQVSGLRSLAVGAEAPEISLPNPDGEIVSLSSLRGNYVLIDFWAAWCKPCRAENPNVVRMYSKYSDENFEILGVSLDRNREAWVKAIEQDGLPWKHVSDLKYFSSEAANDYKIQAIPATYLIDPQGKIIAKGLRGASLEAKLKEIFG